MFCESSEFFWIIKLVRLGLRIDNSSKILEEFCMFALINSNFYWFIFVYRFVFCHDGFDFLEIDFLLLFT